MWDGNVFLYFFVSDSETLKCFNMVVFEITQYDQNCVIFVFVFAFLYSFVEQKHVLVLQSLIERSKTYN